MPQKQLDDKQASKFIRQKQYYDITKYKQYNGRLPEGNPSIELVAYSKIWCYNINSEEKEALGANIKKEMRSWQLRHTNVMECENIN